MSAPVFTTPIADELKFYDFYQGGAMAIVTGYENDPDVEPVYFLYYPESTITPKINEVIALITGPAGRWIKITKQTYYKTTEYYGITDINGNYSVTYPQPFISVPFVLINYIGELPNQKITLITSDINGFTVNLKQRNTVSLLGIEVLLALQVNVANASLRVLVLEKL